MALTTLLALLFNLLPWRDVTGLPDMLALVIAFWCIHQPRRMGMGAAWALGLMMDVANGALLGQHAFAYSVLAFAAIGLNRRILWFGIWPQALHVLLLLLASQLLMLAVRLIAGGAFPGFAWFAGSGVAALLWPAVTFLLLLPQRQPEVMDVDRPI
jgi:rod shape-determining protein MreD